MLQIIRNQRYVVQQVRRNQIWRCEHNFQRENLFHLRFHRHLTSSAFEDNTTDDQRNQLLCNSNKLKERRSYNISKKYSERNSKERNEFKYKPKVRDHNEDNRSRDESNRNNKSRNSSNRNNKDNTAKSSNSSWRNRTNCENSGSSFRKNNDTTHRKRTIHNMERKETKVGYSDDIESLRKIFLNSIVSDKEQRNSKEGDEGKRKENVDIIKAALLSEEKPKSSSFSSSWRTKNVSIVNNKSDDYYEESKKRNEKHYRNLFNTGSKIIPQEKAKPDKKQKKQSTPATVVKPQVVKPVLKLPNNAIWTIHTLSDKLRVGVKKIHTRLIQLDSSTFKDIPVENIRLEADVIELLCEDLGYEYNILEDETETLLASTATSSKQEVEKTGPVRPPVVCIMGHVDHGKTTLLDALRFMANKNSKSVAEGEIGGITQIISAFQVNNTTFLDTPGHAAFSSMRESSNAATDILILVIDLINGVQPQTVEIIDLYKNRQVSEMSLIVALTKLDLLQDEQDRIQECIFTIENQLISHGILLEDIQMIPLSSKTEQGLDDLMEAIDLQAQLMDLRSSVPLQSKSSKKNKKKTEFIKSHGIILEGRMEKGLGVVVDVVVRDGNTFKVGNTVLCHESGYHGKIKRLIDVNGNPIKSSTAASPSQPVRIIGLKSIPISGETIMTVDSEGTAKSILNKKIHNQEIAAEAAAMQQVALSSSTEQTCSFDSVPNDPIVIPLLIKADTHGSLNAVKDLITNIKESTTSEYKKSGKDLFRVDLISSSIGPITFNDLQLAQYSDASIYVFGASSYIKTAVTSIKSTATTEDYEVPISSHDIIYGLIDELQKKITNSLPSIPTKVVHGTAVVQQIFELNVSNNSNEPSTIAGLRIEDGAIHRRIEPSFKSNVKYQIKRNNDILFDDLNVGSLRKLKDDAEIIKKGEECGLGLLDFHDYRKGDIIECYTTEMSRRSIF